MKVKKKDLAAAIRCLSRTFKIFHEGGYHNLIPQCHTAVPTLQQHDVGKLLLTYLDLYTRYYKIDKLFLIISNMFGSGDLSRNLIKLSNISQVKYQILHSFYFIY